MRLTEVLHRSQRKKANELCGQYKRQVGNYRFMQAPVLMNSVTAKTHRTKSMPCQQPYSMLMKCWKDSNFQEGFCLPESKSYQECMQRFEVDTLRAKEQDQVSELDGGWQKSKRLSSAQANILLKMFPRPGYEFKITHNFNKPLTKPLSFKEDEEKFLNNSYHKRIWKR